jgi:hypothetical protein
MPSILKLFRSHINEEITEREFYRTLLRLLAPWIVAFIIFLVFFKIFIEESGSKDLIYASAEILCFAFLIFVVLVLPFLIYLGLMRLTFIRNRRWHKPFIILGSAVTPMVILLSLLPETRGALFIYRPRIASGILLSIFLFLSYSGFAITYGILNRRNLQAGRETQEEANGKSENAQDATKRLFRLSEIIFVLAAIATVASLLYAILRDVVPFGR